MWCEFLDIFAGTGGVGAALASYGANCVLIDVNVNKNDDVTNPMFIKSLRASLREHKIAGVMIAPPCNSFSLAVSRSGRALRSKECPRGLPKDMSISERERVRIGNQLLDVSISILELLIRFGIPVIWENPASSYMWHCPQFRKTYENAQHFTCTIHQCAFGTRYKKATRFLFVNIIE